MEIVPMLLIAVFIAGMFASAVKDNALAEYVKGNNIFSSLVGAFLGASFYFPTLIEVPLAKVLLDLGMDRGAIVAFILAGYVLSPPTVFFLRRIIGPEKTKAYVVLVMLCATLSGIAYGSSYRRHNALLIQRRKSSFFSSSYLGLSRIV